MDKSVVYFLILVLLENFGFKSLVEGSNSCQYIFEDARVSCDYRGYNRDACERNGCCWDTAPRNKDLWCYKSECKPGFWGWNCRFQCQCRHSRETCDRFTGDCPSGCPRGKWGVGCLLSDDCTYNDRTAFHYLGKNSRTRDGNTCQSWTLQSSYRDDAFPDKTRANARNYCRNPKPDYGKTWCYYNRRKKWTECTLNECPCLEGRFGINCVNECHCRIPTATCNTLTGACSSGCDPKFQGTDCQECGDGYFGQFCSKRCHCRRGRDICDKRNGTCRSGCASGWQGSDCQKECVDKRFGLNCQFTCNCQNKSEKCDKSDGHCASGCRAGYSGDGCRYEKPRLTRPPFIAGRGAKEITVQWDAWQKPPDRGDGPISKYLVYYRPLRRGRSWRSNRSKINTTVTLRGLQRATAYQVKILPIHGDGFYGYTSPVVTMSTCDKPRSGPVGLSIPEGFHRVIPGNQRGMHGADEEHRSVTLTVTWEPPSDDQLNCDSVKFYKVYMKQPQDSDFKLKGNVTVLKIAVQIQDMYTNYTIGVSVVNNGGLESEMSLVTYTGKSGPVQDLSVVKTTSDSVTIHWNPPSYSNGPIHSYGIHYIETTVSNCHVESYFPGSSATVDAAVQEFTIPRLHSFSKYLIQVWAVTEAKKGLESKIEGTTAASVPNGKVKSLQVSQIRTRAAMLKWQAPDCENRNGAFKGFKYEVRQKDKPNRIVISGSINQTELELEDLIPFATYLFQVWFVNDVGDGPKSDPKELTTLEDTPPAPKNVKILIRTSNNIVVQWDAPSPPHGTITAYRFKYGIGREITNPKEIDLQTLALKFNVTDLKANTTYGMQVKAYTRVGGGEWSKPVYGFTEESIPSEPANLFNSSRSETSVTLDWQDPTKPNGVLKRFKVLCSPVSTVGRFLAHDVEGTVQPHIHQHVVTGLIPGTKYVCAIRASTSKGYGPASRHTIFTLPQAPEQPEAPEIDTTMSTDNSLTVKLQPVTDLGTHTEFGETVYQVVIEKYKKKEKVKRSLTPTPCGLSSTDLTDYQGATDNRVNCYIAAEIPNLNNGKNFIVGDNQTYGGYYNAPLEKGAHYNVWFGVVVTVDGVKTVTYSTAREPAVALMYQAPKKSSDTALMAGVGVGAVVVLILLIIVIALFIVRRGRKKKKSMSNSEKLENSKLEKYYEKEDDSRLDEAVLPDVCGAAVEEDELDCAETVPLYTNLSIEGMRPPLQIKQLWEYVKEKKNSKTDGFKQEYESLAHGLTLKSDVARKPENKVKNRYGNIIAYDQSRVVLECLPGDMHSDYINANYVDAYKKPGAFIATQGPSKHTLNDIWRMAWQMNSHRIVMVTNLVEDGRHKCEQYWPDNGSRQYGDITVEKEEHEELADFTIRVFSLTCDGQTKTIRQFHFTAWPDHGVPLYATSLLAFRRKVRCYDDPTAGPTIVHCSAGVGRTGTFVALDYLLDQAKAEDQVDIYGFVERLRTKRVNMVQTLEQYVFVYDALLEALKSGETATPCVDFRKQYVTLRKANPVTGKIRLEEEFELLGIMSPSRLTYCKDALSPENINKNRNKDILPMDMLSRPYLLTYIPGTTDYINAVFTDGYKQRDAYIITQMPLPHTVIDFWSLIYDHDCKTIIMMNIMDPSDPTCACYFPTAAGSKQYGPFGVETISVDTSSSDVSVRDMSLTHNKRGAEPRFVRQFQYHGWPKSEQLPLRRASVIELLGKIEKWQQRTGNGPIVVHCMDGATRCGIYCAVGYMVERLKLEQEVDAFQSVKHVRMNRPQLVPTLEQYGFVYDMAVEYMDCFETYSNFK